MGARETILARIRRRQARGGAAPTHAELLQVESYLRACPRGPAPRLSGDLLTHFCRQTEASATTVDRVAAQADVPAAVARYLDAHSLPHSGCVWPQLGHLAWTDAGLELAARAASGNDEVGVSGALCAIAETGTLVVAASPQTPSVVSLLPETHVAIVPLVRLVASMEDAWELVRSEFGQLPRAVNFISGPSRTADIEQTVVLGAHGPSRVHVILVG